MKKTVLSILLLLLALNASATTYYVSHSIGADSNTSTEAQSKSTPWKDAPGSMAATCHACAHNPVAGDTFILMGCDQWPNAGFPIAWQVSGSSGSPITVGTEDEAWYNTRNCPSAWNRPVFNAGGSPITGSGAYDVFVKMQGGGGSYTTWIILNLRVMRSRGDALVRSGTFVPAVRARQPT